MTYLRTGWPSLLISAPCLHRAVVAFCSWKYYLKRRHLFNYRSTVIYPYARLCKCLYILIKVDKSFQNGKARVCSCCSVYFLCLFYTRTFLCCSFAFQLVSITLIQKSSLFLSSKTCRHQIIWLYAFLFALYNSTLWEPRTFPRCPDAALPPMCIFHTQWNRETVGCYLISTGRNYCGSVIVLIVRIQNGETLSRSPFCFSTEFTDVEWNFSFLRSVGMKGSGRTSGWLVGRWQQNAAPHDNEPVSWGWSDNGQNMFYKSTIVCMLYPYGTLISIANNITHSYHGAHMYIIYEIIAWDLIESCRELWPCGVM